MRTERRTGTGIRRDGCAAADSSFTPAPAPFICLLVIVIAALPGPARGQIFRLPKPDTTRGNYFGAAVAIKGTTAIVGASGVRTCGDNSGAAFIFERNESFEWTRTARLEPDNCSEGLFFGKSVGISGRWAAVVAYVPFFSGAASNAVYIFERAADSTWSQAAVLRQPPGEIEGAFASSISLNGNRLLVTTAGDAREGRFNGAAYVYETDGRNWSLQARLAGSLGPEAGVFGTSGALDGDRAVVAASTYLANRPGTVYVFDRDPTTGDWTESGAIRGILDFFISVDVDGDQIIVGESKAGKGRMGRARIFTPDPDGKWKPVAVLTPPSSVSQGGFGSSVAICGRHALVVGFDEQLSMDFNIDRVVYQFNREKDSSAWRRVHVIDVGDRSFASAIDLDGELAVIGHAADEIVGNAYVATMH